LLYSVQIKWIATKAGFEKIVMKQNKLIGYFINDQQSSFYQSNNFTKVLQFVQTNATACKMKEKQTRNGLRLMLTFENIKSVKQALKVLKPIVA
jgi:transcription-repair coupling factor (superfamily II helicase)